MKRFGIALVITAIVGFWLVPATSANAAPGPCGITGYPPCPPPTGEVGDTNPTPGESTTVSGDNWCPGSTVSIYFDGIFLGTATVDSSGHFSTHIVIPKDASDGHHTISIVGLDLTCENQRTVTIGITIGAAGAAGAAGGGANLPFTGANISMLGLLAIAIAIVGAAALVAGRRREKVAVEK